MKTLIIICTIVTVSFKVDYEAIQLWEMALSADKIVYGEITELRENDYTLKIIASPTNDVGTIKIIRFKSWICATRWAKYERGQRIIVFLEKRENAYHIMNAGDEGEIEVKNNQVKIIAYNFQYKYAVSDLQINTFIKIMKELRMCYGVNKDVRNLPYKKPDCKDDTLNSDKNDNSLYNCLKKEIPQKLKE